MSPNTVDQIIPFTEPDTLKLIYRHLGAMHATLAEADRIDEGLQRRTLDRLMNVLEIIEEIPRAPEADAAALRQTIAEQTGHLDRLAGTIDSLMERQQELRRLLRDAHTQLVERDDEIARLRTRERYLDTQLGIERKRLGRLQGSRWWRFRQTIARVVGR